MGCSEEKSQRHLYKSRPALKLHENDRLTCDECNYKFELQSSLRRHERFGHKGENYAYNRCGYSTKREDKLIVHRPSKHGVLKHPSILVMIVIMKQSVWNTAREPMKIDLLVKNVIKYPCEIQRRKPFKCHIESNHDGPRYPCKDCEAPLNAEAIMKCDKCERTHFGV